MKRVFIVYGITDCPSCLRACADLMDNYPSDEYVFASCDFSPLYRERLKEKYNWSTFPIIVESASQDDKLIGGHTELRLYLHGLDGDSEYPAPPIRDKD